jgi:hypothetical protein
LGTDLTIIITQLEQQRDAIDRALVALRETTDAAAVAPAKRRGRPPGRKLDIAAVAANRRSEGQRRRWAEKRATEKTAATKRGVTKKGLTAAGRKRLSELMKARWASKNPPKKRARS